VSTLLLGLHRPGTTWVHRTWAGAKLVALFVAGVVVTVVGGWQWSLTFVVGGILLLAYVGAGLRRTLRNLRGLMVFLLILGAFQLWQQGWLRAVESVGDLLALVLLATVVTTTTPVDAMVDTMTRALRPFRRLGVNPEAVALAFSLMLRAIPATVEIAEETRQAALARGLERSPRARLTPMVIRVVTRARMTGEALHARGLVDD
jgi:biotin transport system permease protein